MGHNIFDTSKKNNKAGYIAGGVIVGLGVSAGVGVGLYYLVLWILQMLQASAAASSSASQAALHATDPRKTAELSPIGFATGTEGQIFKQSHQEKKPVEIPTFLPLGYDDDSMASL